MGKNFSTMIPLIVLLWSVINLAAAGSDLRVVEAVQKQDKDAVVSLLKQHADVNAVQADGATALAWAAHWNDLEAADLLIRAGANVNAANDYGVTPVALACTNGSAAMVEKLLKAGANPNATQPRTGETALMTCALTGTADAVKSLLAHGADVNAKESKRGQTALMWAVEQKHAAVVRALTEHGADIHTRSAGGFTPLLFSARQGDIESARILLAAGANVNETVPDGLSALLLAIDSGHEAFPIFLLEQGADANSKDRNGMAALHYALRKGITVLQGTHFEAVDPVFFGYWFRPDMPELVKALLARGANPNAKISKQLSLTNGSHRHHHYVGLLGATPFLLAAAANNVGVMRMLVAAGADPLVATADATTPLMVAGGVGRDDFDDKNRAGEEEKAALEALKLTVELGGDVNAANKSSMTALHGAAFTGANEIIQFLVDKGARLDIKDMFGQTALSIAEGDPNGLVDDRERHNHPTTAKLLRSLGADPFENIASAAAKQ